MNSESRDAADRLFDAARSNALTASEARTALSRSWNDICVKHQFWSRTDRTGDEIRLLIGPDWSAQTAIELTAAARSFGLALRASFDLALEATIVANDFAEGPVPVADKGLSMPFVTTSEAWDDWAADAYGLREDQISTVLQFQPFSLRANEQDQTLACLVEHFCNLVDLVEVPSSEMVTAWVHDAAPIGRRRDGAEIAATRCAPDGWLDDGFLVATFANQAAEWDSVATSPQVELDLVFRCDPLPVSGDDNLAFRTRGLLAVANEFIRAMHRSINMRPKIRFRGSNSSESTWQRLEAGRAAAGRQPNVLSELAAIGRHDEDGTVTVMVDAGSALFVRRLAANPLPEDGPTHGERVEIAVRNSVARWGLPDFVLRPELVSKGAAQRELGDGMIVVGKRGLAVQVKSREAPTTDPERERRWIHKKAVEATRQATGTVRAMTAQPRAFTNERGRRIAVDGLSIEWAGLVVLDHPNPPDVIIERPNTGMRVVTLLRRDWEFLFDQLRSTSAVVDYVFRVAADESDSLGVEYLRYYDLAHADADAANSDQPEDEWIDRLGAAHTSRPLLPLAPADAADTESHWMFREILDSISSIDIDRPELERLNILAALDRFSVSDRADLGRLLIRALENSIDVPSGGASWNFRRVIQERGRLQLGFGVCSTHSPQLAEAFRLWAILRHHEYSSGVATDSPRTVAVLLTPRFNAEPPFDTTMVAIDGALLDVEEDLAIARRLFEDTSSSGAGSEATGNTAP